MDTVQVDAGNGKKKVEKVGMKAEQRDGIEYEFTTVLDLTHDNYAIKTKDRTRIFNEPMLLTEHAGVLLKEWLNSGSANACINGNQFLELEALMQQAGIDIEKYCAKRGLNSLHDVQQQKFDETCAGIHSIIQRTHQTQQANEQQLQAENEARLESDYQAALKDIHQANNLNDLKRPSAYFKGTKYEQNILNACQAKSDMEGWSA